ncbi:MAG TPA: peptidoglycan-binding protein, partial [Chitinophagaceae bacterium]|nr:peptidoglycan-binding protein [Chitinophagaceae bacterium]
MKNTVLTIVICWALIGCSDARSGKQGADSGDENQDGKNVTKRDYSITKSNSYSDLFLDSSAVQSFITKDSIPSKIARRIVSFYNARNYQFAWFSGDGLTEQARGFWNMHEYIMAYNPDSALLDKSLQKTMDNLVTEESLSVNASNKTYLNTELKLTHHFIQYILNNYEKGYVKRKEMERFIPAKKQDALELADSLINKKHKDDKYFEDVNLAYRGLKQQLTNYYTIVKNGGWPQVTLPRSKKGGSDPAIPLLKKRLQLSGDMPGADTSRVYNDSLETAIKSFQERHGFTPTGKINEAQLKELNVPAISRLQQLLMNMDRMRWLAAEPQGNLIVVNIPEFAMHVYEGSKKVFDMVVVVG